MYNINFNSIQLFTDKAEHTWISLQKEVKNSNLQISTNFNPNISIKYPHIFYCPPADNSPSAQFFTPNKSPKHHQKDKTSNFINTINQPLSRFASIGQFFPCNKSRLRLPVF